MNVLCTRLSGSSVVKGVGLVGAEAKKHARRHFKTIRESINPVFHAQVVVERIAVEVA